MIKAIISDVDGTLLKNGVTRIDNEVFVTIKELLNRGVIFAVASGRQYPSLKKLFAPVWQDVFFICENGGVMMKNDNFVSQREMDHEKTLALIANLYEYEGCEVLVSIKDHGLIKPKSDEMIVELFNTWGFTIGRYDTLDDLFMPIIKVSLYQKEGLSPKIAQEIEDNWGKDFAVTVSGAKWIDITSSNKVMGIDYLKQHFGFNADEMAVFGDSFNDVDMLNAVTHSFVMEDAVDEMKQHGKYICQSVCGSMKEFLDKNLEL